MTICPAPDCRRILVNDGRCPVHGRTTPAAPKPAGRKPPKIARRELAVGTVDIGQVAIREESAGDGRTLTGYAYRWGELTAPGATEEGGAAAEGFERGAFAAAIAERAGRPWAFLDRHRGATVGAITFTEDDTGLRFDGRLLATRAADDYAAQVAAGLDGASLEFLYTGTNPVRRGGAIIHRTVRRIAAVAGVYAAAYRGATVALRQEGETIMEHCEHCGQPIEAGGAIHTCATPAPTATRGLAVGGGAILPLTPDQVRAIATDTATEMMRAYAERGVLGGGQSADPFAAMRSIGEAVIAARDGGDPALRAYAARALADTVFTAGANAGLASGNLVTDQIQRIVNAGRPAITAFGGGRSIGDVAGLTLSWPYFDGTLSNFVAAQSAEKAEVASAAVDIKLATEALVTYAGGSDVSYQVIRRGAPSVLDAYARIWLAAWAAVTDAAFVAELETGTVTVDTAEAISAMDLTELTGHIVDASIAIQAATGRPAEFVLAGTAAFTRAAKLIAPSATDIAAASRIDLRGLAVGIGNLPIVHAPGITTGKYIASNELAAAWYEDGPFQAAEEDVAKLGRNVAYWSMGAGARFVPAGIVEIYDVTP